jgi:hypothetical protein
LLVAVGEATGNQRQGLVTDEAAQDLDVLGRLALVGRGEGFEDLRNGRCPKLAELGEQLLAAGGGRVRFLTNLRDEPIGL